MTQLTRPPGLPLDWATPGTRPPEGLPKRIATVDPNGPDQLVSKQLTEAAAWAASGKHRNFADLEMLAAAGAAYKAAVELPEAKAQRLQRLKAREAARCYLETVGLSDAELCGALALGLRKMARTVSCRVDAFEAHTFEIGCEMAAHALGVLIPSAKELETNRSR